MFTRRSFVKSSLIGLAASPLLSPIKNEKGEQEIMTVNGPIKARSLGTTLIHEHILVDFIGADKSRADRWNDDHVIEKVLPYLREVKALGCNTIVDCTPNHLGRDVMLLKRCSTLSGLQIITNTGYYGGSDHKFLPPNAFTETAEQLAIRWVDEWKNGIEGTGIRPGFIKISVNGNKLSDISKKLIKAAALAHLETGLTIAAHTGPAVAAFEEIEIIKETGVDPSAFIWVHAQMEDDPSTYISAAKQGAWVSLDSVDKEYLDVYVKLLMLMKKEGQLHRTLISHDAGWYDPEKPGGGSFKGYTAIFQLLIPALKRNGFTPKEIDQLLKQNPKDAFSIRVRKT